MHDVHRSRPRRQAAPFFRLVQGADGWLKPCVIDPAVKQKLILSPINGSAEECYKVLLRPDGSEYLLLENRVKKGFDRDLPAEGLLIWRVVDGKPVLEESHGITTLDGPSRVSSAPCRIPARRIRHLPRTRRRRASPRKWAAFPCTSPTFAVYPTAGSSSKLATSFYSRPFA